MRKITYNVNGTKVNTYAEARAIQPTGQLPVSFETIKEDKKIVSKMRQMMLAEKGYCF